MIPVRLELRNFMSYGDQVAPLDFTGIRLACLCGDNGNGKSALLDAVTWALWGEARASADELIRLGTDEMRVVFDFLLGDDLYRVIRGRSKRNSSSVWEVCVAEQAQQSAVSSQPSAGEGQGGGQLSPSPPPRVSPSDVVWRPITGQGIRDTGRLIQRILRMDYKTFISSAYIQQGRADEFTKQTVSDRKKILADILDLSRYDALEQKAKARRNEAEQRVKELEREIGQIELELANEDTYRQELDKSKAERDALEAEIGRMESRLRECQGRQAELEGRARRIKELEEQASGWQSEMESLVAQRSDQEHRVARSREAVKDRERILSGLEKLRSARESASQLDGRLEELRTLEREKASLGQQVLVEKHKLEIERQSLSKELSELESKIGSAPSLDKDAASLRGQVGKLDALDARRAELQAEVSAESDRWGALKAQHERLVHSRQDLEDKLKMLSEPAAKCPLCQTKLDREKHEALVAQYAQDIKDAGREIQALKKQGSAAKAKRDAAQEQIARIDEQVKAGLEIRKQLAQAEQVLFQIAEYRKQVPDVRAKLDAVAGKLSSGDFAPETRSKLEGVQARIGALGYDADEHRRVKEELAGLEQFESLAVSLKHAEESLPGDEANLRAMADLIAAREKSIAECKQSIRELSESLAELPSVTSEISDATTSLQSLREADRGVTGKIATLKHSLERCKSLRVEVSDKRKELEKAKTDKAAYAELVAAFGKKGVQALIIENAIPEIQEEANRLLARMTDNAMQVSIETVRDKKTGGTAETLDIRISDDMGTRSYELYSGGEAFRINFALRIALSKLLARRAGARLQTLIIDEGFGTQDGKGRDKLVEAIDSIRDDFEKILVITHIDELKDAFPTRIEITKDSQGSQISVN